MLFVVPTIQVEVSPEANRQALVVAAGIALAAMVAVSGVEVSKTCGVCPGPGTLCTRLLCAMSTDAGEPGAFARVKARTAEDAHPGRWLVADQATSSKTLRPWTAVPR